VELANLKIPDVLKKYIERIQALFTIRIISKKKGRKNIVSMATALYQNSYFVVKKNIPEMFLKNPKHFPQYNMSFVPLDGPATVESIKVVLDLLPSSLRTFPLNELYALMMMSDHMKVRKREKKKKKEKRKKGKKIVKL
jgi:hypothetical protein